MTDLQTTVAAQGRQGRRSPDRDAVLEVENFHVRFLSSRGPLDAVRGASFRLEPGETLALVGESGSGKSTLARAITRQTQPPFTRDTTAVAGRAVMRRKDGEVVDLVAADRRVLRKVRARDIALISQDALSGLNPVLSVGSQMTEVLRVIRPGLPRATCRAQAADLLSEVDLPDPVAMLSRYPHQLSGGQRQRVMIAMALARDPAVLVADEPTTALDATVQSRLIDLLKREQAKRGMALIFISHDIDVVLRIADRIGVMYAGQIVEMAPVEAFLGSPRHPYTAGLLASRPGYRGAVVPLVGYAPHPQKIPQGCAFHPRCPHADARCAAEAPSPRVHAPLCWKPLS